MRRNPVQDRGSPAQPGSPGTGRWGETRMQGEELWGCSTWRPGPHQGDSLTWRKRLSSWCRMGMFSYSAALEMISISPRTLVLAFSDMLKSSAGEDNEHFGSAALLQYHP